MKLCMFEKAVGYRCIIVCCEVVYVWKSSGVPLHYYMLWSCVCLRMWWDIGTQLYDMKLCMFQDAVKYQCIIKCCEVVPISGCDGIPVCNYYYIVGLYWWIIICCEVVLFQDTVGYQPADSWVLLLCQGWILAAGHRGAQQAHQGQRTC